MITDQESAKQKRTPPPYGDTEDFISGHSCEGSQQRCFVYDEAGAIRRASRTNGFLLAFSVKILGKDTLVDTELGAQVRSLCESRHRRV